MSFKKFEICLLKFEIKNLQSLIVARGHDNFIINSVSSADSLWTLWLKMGVMVSFDPQ